MPIDSGLIGALHIERVGVWDVRLVEHPHHTLFQTSTVDALLGGNYEGDVSFAELEAYGDFGLGTFDALDGEMIALDGAFYQVKADGRAYDVDERMKTPFAVVTFFEPREIRQLTPSTNYTALRARLDELVATDANDVPRRSRRRSLQLRKDAQRPPSAQALPAPCRGGQAPADLRVSRSPGQPRRLSLSRVCRGTQRIGLPLPLYHRGPGRRRSPARVRDSPRRAPRRSRVGSEPRASGRRRRRPTKFDAIDAGRAKSHRKRVGTRGVGAVPRRTGIDPFPGRCFTLPAGAAVPALPSSSSRHVREVPICRGKVWPVTGKGIRSRSWS